jgi:hypothetical protein
MQHELLAADGRSRFVSFLLGRIWLIRFFGLPRNLENYNCLLQDLQCGLRCGEHFCLTTTFVSVSANRTGCWPQWNILSGVVPSFRRSLVCKKRSSKRIFTILLFNGSAFWQIFRWFSVDWDSSQSLSSLLFSCWVVCKFQPAQFENHQLSRISREWTNDSLNVLL